MTEEILEVYESALKGLKDAQAKGEKWFIYFGSVISIDLEIKRIENHINAHSNQR